MGMSNNKITNCPRCQTNFECKAEDIKKCQCASIVLEQHQREYISERYEACLCISCLEQLQMECEKISN